MGSAVAPRVCAQPGACARLLDELEARTAAENAAIVARTEPMLRRQRALVDRFCGPDGGHLNFHSSPFFMWLAHRLSKLGELAVEVVEDDLEAYRAHLKRQARRP